MTDSTCKSEYIETSEATKKATWLKNFINDLGVIHNIKDPMEIFCDSVGSVAFSKEPKDHGKSRHILSNYHYVRKWVKDGNIVINRVSSEENTLDPFTKLFSRINHDCHNRSIGIRIADDMVWLFSC